MVSIDDWVSSPVLDPERLVADILPVNTAPLRFALARSAFDKSVWFIIEPDILPHTAAISWLLILIQETADLTARSPIFHVVIPPKLVEPATDTLHAKPVEVARDILGEFKFASQSAWSLTAAPTLVSIYDLTACCEGYNVSDVPRFVSVDLLVTFSGVKPRASCLLLNTVNPVEVK